MYFEILLSISAGFRTDKEDVMQNDELLNMHPDQTDTEIQKDTENERETAEENAADSLPDEAIENSDSADVLNGSTD